MLNAKDSQARTSPEAMEGRRVASKNTKESPTSQTQSCADAKVHRVSMGLDGVRQIAKAQQDLRFTSLLHHITPSLLVESFYDLNRKSAAVITLVNPSRHPS